MKVSIIKQLNPSQEPVERLSFEAVFITPENKTFSLRKNHNDKRYMKYNIHNVEVFINEYKSYHASGEIRIHYE